jgi:uncharacterized heparinase superfamily protein
VVSGDPADLDALLRRLFPAIGDRPIVDEPLPVPDGVVYADGSFGPYALTNPIDWRADPFGNNSWQLSFQSLRWLASYSDGGGITGLDTAAAVLTDWVDRAMYEVPAVGESWGDHTMALRFEATVDLALLYIATRPTLNRRFLHAAAQLLASHVYTLAAECRYVTGHNHSLMHDLAILRQVKRFPALRDGVAIWELAERRMLERQVGRSVTSDGVHAENSPCYHRHFIDLLHEALSVYRDIGVSPPKELIGTRDAMIEPLVQLIQPDLSFVQFGDCSDADRLDELVAVGEAARELFPGDPSILAPLDWLVSRGAAGAAPALDQVYRVGGYAVFRDRWDPAAPEEATVGHFKTRHLSGVHYHADETSIEIFAFGRELIVGPGYFTYSTNDPLREYQRSPAAQNILVVDDDSTVSTRPTLSARVVAQSAGGDVPWVQGTHLRYRELGVSSLVRTFAFAKPDTFIVIDHVRAEAPHDYAQHFHLHPDLSEIQVADDRTVLASMKGGPSLAIAAATAPDAIETPRGVDDGQTQEGWYFPAFQVKRPAYDVVFRRTASTIDLPIVIVIGAPGKPAPIPTDIALLDEDGVMTVSWRLDGETRTAQIPRP